MLPAAQRLTSSTTFREVVRRGHRCGGPLLIVHLLAPAAPEESRGPVETPARAGLVVAKSVGNAVARNRVKRRLRHLVRPLLDDLAPGTLVVLRAQPRAARASSAEIAAELRRCLTQCVTRSVTPAVERAR